MRSFGLKRRMESGELTIGSWLSFSYLPLVEMMARSEFDWMVTDLEHTTIDLDQMLAMTMLIEQAGLSPLVRVGANDPLTIKRVMDAGAHGVLVPDVRSAAEASRAVEAVYYPPRGRRGAGLARAQSYGQGFQEYRDWLEQEAVVVVQIEHVDAVADIDAILAVDGVAGYIIGPYDLSASIGKPGEFSDGEVVALFDRVAEVVARSSKPAGMHVVHPDVAKLAECVEQGYRFIAYGDDMVFFSAAVEAAAAHVRDLPRG